MLAFKRYVWRSRAKRRHWLICLAELSRGTIYSFTTLHFFPSLYLLCVSVYLCLLRVYLAFFLSIFWWWYLPNVWSKKPKACPQIWIRFTQDLGLCLVLFALRSWRWNFLQNSLVQRFRCVWGYLSWTSRRTPYTSCPCGFYLHLHVWPIFI